MGKKATLFGLIVVLAVMVGFIALSMLLPIFKLNNLMMK